MRRISHSSIWFLCGLGLGLITVGLSYGAVPEPASPAGESRVVKMKTPDLEDEFFLLQKSEKQFVESPSFQKRLKRAARAGAPAQSVR